MIHENMVSYYPDMASEIDTEREIIADEYGVSLEKADRIIADRKNAHTQSEALILGQVIGLLINSKNLPVMTHALALAAGLDQLNGAHSETEVAKKLGVSKAILSHYVVGWRDLLSGKEYSFDVLKFRKRNGAREVYAEKTKSPFLEAKARISRGGTITRNQIRTMKNGN
jgi:hypothetical protein